MFILISRRTREVRECPGDHVEASLLSDLLLLLAAALAGAGSIVMILTGLWPVMLGFWVLAVEVFVLSVVFHDREWAVHSD